MNKHRADIIKMTILIIWSVIMVSLISLNHHYGVASEWALSVILSIPFIYMLTHMTISLVNSWIYRRQRLMGFKSKPGCYQLINSRSDVVFAFLKPVSMIAFGLAFGAYCLMDKHGGMRPQSYLWLPWFVPINLLFFFKAILELANNLTAHVCITEQGIGIESIVKELRLHRILWEQVTSVKVKRQSASNDIRRVVVQRRLLTPVVIPGNHPDIQRILQDIREHAPDMVAKTLLG
ncbi:MAG: hypothetical protein ACYC1M_17015 [Armatimonadota bacterium]